MRRDYVIEMLGLIYLTALCAALRFGQLGSDSLINFLVQFYTGI